MYKATKRQKQYANDIAKALEIPLPSKETVEEIGKFIAENCEQYHKFKKAKKDKKEQTTVQEVDVRIRLQNIKQRLSAKPLSSPQAIIDFMQQQVKNYSSEAVFVVNLDTQNQVINFCKIGIGTIDKCLISTREVFKSAILSNAAKVLLFHNHISGSTEPSKDDIAVTHMLVQSGELLGIPVLDHIIVSLDQPYYSFLEHRKLNSAVYESPK